jgi:hypothetical protein
MRHTQSGQAGPGSLRETLTNGATSGMLANSVAENILQSASVRVNFVETWNKFMHKLRYDDLLSDNEASLYKCLKLTGFDDIKLEPLLPVLLTLEGCEKVLDELDSCDAEYAAYVFYSINDAHHVERPDGSRPNRWESDMSKRYEKQQLKEKKREREWSNMAIKKVREVQTRKSFSGPREAIRQVRTLSFYLINKTLGVERHREDIVELAGWLPTIGDISEDHANGQWDSRETFVDEVGNPISYQRLFSPFLANLMKVQKAGGAKGSRRNLKGALVGLAELIAVEVCYPVPGLSKQRGETFSREHVRGGFKGIATIKKMRGALEKVLNIVRDLCDDPVGELNREENIRQAIKNVLDNPHGFFKDDEYATMQIKELARSDTSTNAIDASTYLKHLLVTMQFEASPACDEARRRILTFASSLHMDMPAPVLVKNMRSLTTLTPFYDEDVLYDQQQITGGTPSWCFYLKAMHPHEWSNMFERMGINGVNVDPPKIPEQVWSDPKMTMEVRLWASLRGQTLARVIHGVMQYDEALQLFAQHEHENEFMPQGSASSSAYQSQTSPGQGRGNVRGAVWRSETLPQKHAHQKYGYVISCQIYGAYTREKKNKARMAKVKQIKDLLRLFPHLRIAYTDEDKAPGGNVRHYSCLMRWDEPTQDTKEIYRIELPGHMLVGEGKPENQNHAIIFTRGEALQTLDMNQDGYFEEALKMRNLLREFDTDRVAIIGFPEHQFTEVRMRYLRIFCQLLSRPAPVSHSHSHSLSQTRRCLRPPSSRR